MIHIRNNTVFQWDEEKNEANINKHGISFATASLVFDDDDRIEIYDEGHSENEDRFITIGMINEEAIIAMVVYTPRDNSIRLISARKANRQEKEMYYDNY